MQKKRVKDKLFLLQFLLSQIGVFFLNANTLKNYNSVEFEQCNIQRHESGRYIAFCTNWPLVLLCTWVLLAKTFYCRSVSSVRLKKAVIIMVKKIPSRETFSREALFLCICICYDVLQCYIIIMAQLQNSKAMGEYWDFLGWSCGFFR